MNRVGLIRSVGDGTKINRDNEGLISLGTALSQKVMKNPRLHLYQRYPSLPTQHHAVTRNFPSHVLSRRKGNQDELGRATPMYPQELD